MKNWLLVSIVLVLALVAAACGGSDETQDSASVGASETADVNDTTDPDATSDPAPAAEPDPTAEVEPEPTPEPAPTQEPEPEPTDEPEPEPVAEEEVDPDTASTALVSGCGSGSAAGTTTQTFEFEGRERTFEQVVPSSYNDTDGVPVVLNWHGLGSSGPEQVGFSDYLGLVESEGFILIAPTGLPSSGDGRNSWELAPEQEADRDDLAFANTLLDLVIETLCVDESRVYTTGMSNGGYFSSVLVCDMSDRIAAAASVAALSHPDTCNPDRIVPYIGFHGTDDEVVPYAGGGESSLAPGEIIELFELKILDEFTEFAVASGCNTEPNLVEFSDNVNQFDFENCQGDYTMSFYEIEGGGHTWPGSAISIALSEAFGLGVTTSEINASQTSWDFFEQHSLPQN